MIQFKVAKINYDTKFQFSRFDATLKISSYGKQPINAIPYFFEKRSRESC